MLNSLLQNKKDLNRIYSEQIRAN